MVDFMERSKAPLIVALACVGAVIIAGLVFAQHAAAGRAELDNVRRWEAANEAELTCAKWKMPIGTPDHLSCMADIKTVRENHEKRYRDEY